MHMTIDLGELTLELQLIVTAPTSNVAISAYLSESTGSKPEFKRVGEQVRSHLVIGVHHCITARVRHSAIFEICSSVFLCRDIKESCRGPLDSYTVSSQRSHTRQKIWVPFMPISALKPRDKTSERRVSNLIYRSSIRNLVTATFNRHHHPTPTHPISSHPPLKTVTSII